MKILRFLQSSCAVALLFLVSASLDADIVQSWDFSTDGDFESWSTNNVTNAAVAGGFLTGTAAGNDPQLIINSLALDAAAGETWDSVTFIVEETDEAPANVAFDPTGIVVALNGGGGGLTFINSATGVDLGGGVWELTVDISTAASTTINSIRVDPIGGGAGNSNSETAGNSFAVDRIQVLDTAVAIPEPTSFAFLGLVGIGLLSRRRKG